MAVGDQGNVVVLFEGQASDATSAEYVLTGDKKGHYVTVNGNFGGGTLTLEMQIAGNWAKIDGGEFTEAGVKFLEGNGSSKRIRAVLSGSSGASLNVGVTK